jgi:hypothetical protein
MATQLTAQQLHEALKTIIDLPRGVTSLDLRLRIGELPQLTVSCYVYGPNDHVLVEGQSVKQEVRKFVLVEADEHVKRAQDWTMRTR